MLARLPRRHVVVGLTFLACVIAYTDRVNISVAAVAMREHFGWSQTQKGVVLSAFFVGYLLFMFIAGLLATRFGGRRVLGVSVLAWSVLTLVTPWAGAISLGALVAARAGMGIGEAAMFPTSYELFGRWTPATERARAVALMLSGVPLGTVIGLMVSGWLVERYGWPAPFYAFGVVGLGWVAWWFAEVAEHPSLDPRMGAAERALLHAQERPGPPPPLPLRRLLAHGSVWGIVAAHFATTWSLYVLLSWLPSYFRDVQHLSIANAGLLSSAPWLAMFVVTNAAAWLSDRMIQRGVAVTLTRKLMQCGGLVVSGVLLLAMRDAHTPLVAFGLLCTATGALGTTWCGFAPAILDVVPRHGGVLNGFSNSVATIPGVVGVVITGWLVDITGTYSAAFLLTALVSAAGALAFGLRFEARPIVP